VARHGDGKLRPAGVGAISFGSRAAGHPRDDAVPSRRDSVWGARPGTWG
jgi:hypothetical protein